LLIIDLNIAEWDLYSKGCTPMIYAILTLDDVFPKGPILSTYPRLLDPKTLEFIFSTALTPPPLSDKLNEIKIPKMNKDSIIPDFKYLGKLDKDISSLIKLS
jgi:hypothetical protein